MKNLVAIGVLVVLGAVVALTFREKPDTEKEKIVDSIRPPDVEKVDTIKVVRQEGLGDEKREESYTLEKKDGTWRMVSPVSYPVVQSTVESMVKALGDLRVIDVISEKREAHGKFAVDDKEGIKVTALSGDQALLDIIIGNAKSGVTFARLPGQDPVYRMQGSFKFNVDRSIKALREKTIVQMEIDDLEQVTFVQGTERLTLAREGEEKDVSVKPVDRNIEDFDASKALSTVRSAIRLNAVDFVDEVLPEETTGLGETADKYTVVGKKDGEPYTVTVLLGEKTEEKSQVYARSTESDQVFLISKFTADRLRANAEALTKKDDGESAPADKANVGGAGKKKSGDAAAKKASAGKKSGGPLKAEGRDE